MSKIENLFFKNDNIVKPNNTTTTMSDLIVTLTQLATLSKSVTQQINQLIQQKKKIDLKQKKLDMDRKEFEEKVSAAEQKYKKKFAPKKRRRTTGFNIFFKEAKDIDEKANKESITKQWNSFSEEDKKEWIQKADVINEANGFIKKKKKDKIPVVKARTTYAYFRKFKKEELATLEEHKSKNYKQLMEIVSKLWSEVKDDKEGEEYTKYQKMADDDKIRYRNDMNEYKNSLKANQN